MLPMSTRSWNVIKFFLVEVLVSVVLSSTFVRVVRARVGILRANGHKVRLFESGLGRLTPYNLIWERHIVKPAHVEAPNGPVLRRKSLGFLFLVNVIVLLLLVTAEFGSDSTRLHAQTDSRGFGKNSANRLLERDPSISDYSKYRVVQPAISCIREAKNSSISHRILPFTESSPQCIHTEDHEVSSESVSFSACAVHALEVGVPECRTRQISKMLGQATGGMDWISEKMAIHVSGSRELSKDSDTPKLLGTDNPGGDYKIVEGSLKRGAKDVPRSGNWTGRASAICLISSFSAGDYVLPGDSNNKWQVRSCMVYSPGSVLVFGVDHHPNESVGGTQVANPQQIENFRMSKYAMLMMKSNSLTARPHLGILLALAGQCKIAFGLEKAPLTLQRNVVEAFAKTNMYRLLGFVQQLGEYTVPVYLDEKYDQATIDLRFIIPIVLLLMVGLAQLCCAYVHRNDEIVIADLGSALKLLVKNEGNEKHDQWT